VKVDLSVTLFEPTIAQHQQPTNVRVHDQ